MATSWISVSFSPLSLSAAFSMMVGSVEMPTVKMEGTSIRIFWRESALFKSTAMEMGVRSR